MKRIGAKDVLICGLLLLGFITLFRMLKFNVSEEREKALTDLNLKLTGIVEKVDKPPSRSSPGVINVRVTSSNVKYYDPRNELKYYYCIIDSNRAGFYDVRAFEVNPGDSIRVDTRDNKFYRKPPRGDWSAGPITLSTSDSFYNYVRKHHQTIIPH